MRAFGRIETLLFAMFWLSLMSSSCAKRPPSYLPPPPPYPPPPAPPPPPHVVDPGSAPLPSACRGVPRFPWRPARPSGWYAMPNLLFARPDATLATVANDLRAALESAGYEQPRFFCMNGGGLALVTRFERFREDGTPWPLPMRWNSAPTGLIEGEEYTIVNIVKALVHAKPGRYRMIVFVVGPLPIVPSDRVMTRAEGDLLASRGALQLPWGFDAYPFRAPNAVTALVYEFARPTVSADPKPVSTIIPLRQQLLAAGVLRGQPARLAR